MRRLWSDHVIWTRTYIVATAAGTPDAEVAASRLLRNARATRNSGFYFPPRAANPETGLMVSKVFVFEYMCALDVFLYIFLTSILEYMSC